jgi:hypothetical protein
MSVPLRIAMFGRLHDLTTRLVFILQLPGIFLGTIPLFSKTDNAIVSSYSSLLMSTDDKAFSHIVMVSV